MDQWNNIHGVNNLADVPAPPVLPISKDRSDCIYTQKHQAKQPCLDTEGATESNECSSSVRMDDIHVHVGLGDKSGSTA